MPFCSMEFGCGSSCMDDPPLSIEFKNYLEILMEKIRCCEVQGQPFWPAKSIDYFWMPGRHSGRLCSRENSVLPWAASLGHCQRGLTGLGWPCWLSILDMCKSCKIVLQQDKCKGDFDHCWNLSLMPEICYTLSLYTIARCSSLASVFQNTSIQLHS